MIRQYSILKWNIYEGTFPRSLIVFYFSNLSLFGRHHECKFKVRDLQERINKKALSCGCRNVRLLWQICADHSQCRYKSCWTRGPIPVQEQNGEFSVISYASRSLSDIERRYPQMSNGVEFELLTDHKSLKCIYLLSTD